MKAIKLLTASALLAGLAALSFAGPSAQFSASTAPKPHVQPAKVCGNCACCSMTR